MVREAKITQEEVNAAADKIRGAGIKPTNRAVREALGRGSMGTIMPLVQVWQSSQMQAPEAPATLPNALQRVLVDFVAQEVAAAKGVLESDLVTMRQANTDLIAESQHLGATIEGQSHDVELLQANNAEIAGRLAQLGADMASRVVQLNADLDAARNEVQTYRSAAEAIRTDKAKLELRLEGVPRLEEEAARWKAAYDLEHVGRIDSDQLAAVATAKLDKTEEQRTDMESRTVQLNVNLDAARKEVQTYRSAAEAIRTDKAKLELRLEGMPRLEEEVTRWKAAYDQEHVARIESDQLAAVAKAKLDKTEEQRADLHRQVQAARPVPAANFSPAPIPTQAAQAIEPVPALAPLDEKPVSPQAFSPVPNPITPPIKPVQTAHPALDDPLVPASDSGFAPKSKMKMTKLMAQKMADLD